MLITTPPITTVEDLENGNGLGATDRNTDMTPVPLDALSETQGCADEACQAQSGAVPSRMTAPSPAADIVSAVVSGMNRQAPLPAGAASTYGLLARSRQPGI